MRGAREACAAQPLPSQWFIKIRNKNTEDNSLLSSLSQRTLVFGNLPILGRKASAFQAEDIRLLLFLNP
jgi:hypothetical protein